MTGSPPELAADPPPGEVPSGTLEPDAGVTRISAAWVAIGVSLLVLVLSLISILQKLQQVRIHFVGLSGRIPLGSGSADRRGGRWGCCGGQRHPAGLAASPGRPQRVEAT